MVSAGGQRQSLQAELDRTSAAAARYADSATLFEALGGGWWNTIPAATVDPKTQASAR